MNYSSINKLLKSELFELNNLIEYEINNSNSAVISTISDYILSAGGKRLRPLILLLTANMFKTESNIKSSYLNKDCIKLAAVLELIHTATLLHDDIIDNSSVRRNNTSAHLKWGTRNSIIAGDWIFALAFELAASTNNIKLIKIISDMTNVLAIGELNQLHNKNMVINIEDYFLVIEQKTALLFSVATELAAVALKQSNKIIEITKKYGLYLGLCFQIVDDILDYLGDPKLIGKNLGDDLLDEKLTIPMIYLKQRDSDYFEYIIRKVKKNAILNKDFVELKNYLCKTGAIEDSYKQAIVYQTKALDCLYQLPDNQYRSHLKDLTAQIVARSN